MAAVIMNCTDAVPIFFILSSSSSSVLFFFFFFFFFFSLVSVCVSLMYNVKRKYVA